MKPSETGARLKYLRYPRLGDRTGRGRGPEAGRKERTRCLEAGRLMLRGRGAERELVPGAGGRRARAQRRGSGTSGADGTGTESSRALRAGGSRRCELGDAAGEERTSGSKDEGAGSDSREDDYTTATTAETEFNARVHCEPDSFRALVTQNPSKQRWNEV